MSSRPTWAEVSLPVLCANFRAIQQHVGPEVIVCAVVKADAYGHGTVECARALESAGAEWFGVTCTEEGVQLREAGVRRRILVMTGIWRGEESEIIRHGLTPAVWEGWHIEALAQAASGRAAQLPLHVKVDTGMGRLGVTVSDLPAFLARMKSARNLAFEGLFTHLASSENPQADDLTQQLSAFQQASETVRNAGFSPAYCHLANSAAIVSRPESWKTNHGNARSMVRPGISLYGYYLPFAAPVRQQPDVQPVLTWKTRVICLRSLSAGQRVGYNGTWTAARQSKIAVLPVGYADGLNRMLSSRGRVIVRGRYARMVGRVSMDITIIDVTDIPNVEVGDEVVLIGSSGQLSITVAEHAALAGTIPYEILCNISKRVPRRYVAETDVPLPRSIKTATR